jgi:hypothetical protein
MTFLCYVRGIGVGFTVSFTLFQSEEVGFVYNIVILFSAIINSDVIWDRPVSILLYIFCSMCFSF